MDKVFSVRLDEHVIQRVTWLSRYLGLTKKAVIERAVRGLAEQVEREDRVNPLAASHGAWDRQESAAETVERARAAFRSGLERRRP